MKKKIVITRKTGADRRMDNLERQIKRRISRSGVGVCMECPVWAYALRTLEETAGKTGISSVGTDAEGEDCYVV